MLFWLCLWLLKLDCGVRMGFVDNCRYYLARLRELVIVRSSFLGGSGGTISLHDRDPLFLRLLTTS